MSVDKDLNKLLEKYIAGNCSPQEKKWVEQWYETIVSDDPINIELSEAEKKQLLNSIQSKINLQKLKRKKTFRLFPQIFSISQTAAMWAGLILLSSFLIWISISKWFNPTQKPQEISYVEVKTEYGQTGSALLPDSSQVWLNANTKLKYQKNFRQNRFIMLEEGEAFFEVKPDKAHPFIIQTLHGVKTEVLGTSFNVKAYQSLKEVEVTIQTGKVSVTQDQDKPTKLTPGQRIRYHQNRTQQLSRVLDINSIGKWRQGEWILDDASWQEWCLLIYNFHHIRLITKEPAILKARLSANIKQGQPLPEILEILCAQLGCQYRQSSDTIELYLE